MGNVLSSEELKQKVTEAFWPEKDKKELIDVYNGEKLAELYRDAIVKRVFSPDEHPERLDFLLQRIMRDESIETMHSASNEGVLKSAYSKKIITDLPAWIKDHRRADLEIQAVAQDYIFNRADIYSSEMLMVQYSAAEGQSKEDVGYGNVNGVIVVVLMVKSPKIFKEYNSDRYIHRITKAVADSGMEFPMLRQIAFVQLDKALELFLADKYNKDEDIDLLKIFAMIADINNEEVIAKTKDNRLCDDIRKEVAVFSKDREVQAMLLEEKMAIMDWEANRNDARREGLAEGRAEGLTEGRTEVMDVFNWLINAGRGDDVAKATQDKAYYDVVLSEYKNRK